MDKHFRSNSRTLHNGTFRSEVAEEGGNTAGFAVGFVDRTNDLFVLVFCISNVFGNCLAGNRHQVGLEKSFLVELFHHCRNAAGFIELFNKVRTGRRKMAEVRSFFRDFVCQVHVELVAAFMSDSRQMQHGVRRAS